MLKQVGEIPTLLDGRDTTVKILTVQPSSLVSPGDVILRPALQCVLLRTAYLWYSPLGGTCSELPAGRRRGERRKRGEEGGKVGEQREGRESWGAEGGEGGEGGREEREGGEGEKWREEREGRDKVGGRGRRHYNISVLVIK